VDGKAIHLSRTFSKEREDYGKKMICFQYIGWHMCYFWDFQIGWQLSSRAQKGAWAKAVELGATGIDMLPGAWDQWMRFTETTGKHN
jgi:hypothetical protein